MSIAVTASSGRAIIGTDSISRRSYKLAITGLTAGADNTVPHGLAFTPRMVGLRPSALGLWAETAAPDATNIYITVGGGGATSGTVDVSE